ncbi:MAG: beta-ketoacyl-ACP synthase III [Desulfohalobiaceae bacterium]
MADSINILGLGHYIPESVLTNQDLEQMVNTDDDWIVSRTGIRQRRLASKGQGCSDLAWEASRQALEQSGTRAEELSHILVATFTPDYCTPTTACVLQDKLGASNCMMAMDIGAGCSGFVYGLDTARGICSLQPGAKVLVVGSEVCTSRVNFQDRNTCVLFGDGAGAAVVSCAQSPGMEVQLLDTLLKADGSLGHLLPVGRRGGSVEPFSLGDRVDEEYFIHMKGRELFRHAVRGMAEITHNVLERNGLRTQDVDLFIPHQANLRIIEALAKKLEYPMQKVFVNVDRLGNTSAASVIIALSEAQLQDRIRPGYTVLLVAFGAGLTWGAGLLRF